MLRAVFPVSPRYPGATVRFPSPNGFQAAHATLQAFGKLVLCAERPSRGTTLPEEQMKFLGRRWLFATVLGAALAAPILAVIAFTILIVIAHETNSPRARTSPGTWLAE